MPKIEKFSEKACWSCFFYRVGPGDPGDDEKDPDRTGGPFCRFFKRYFPNPDGHWRDKNIKPPGSRICKNWRKKEIKNAMV